MGTKGNEYLKNGIKNIKILAKLKEVNEDILNPRCLWNRRKLSQIKKTAIKMKKEIGRLRETQVKLENRDAAGQNELVKAFLKRELNEIEKRICFYLLALAIDDMGIYSRRNDNEIKAIMNIVCADGIADPIDTLCDYMIFGRLDKIDLIEQDRLSGDEKLFERGMNPSKILLEAAVGSLLDENKKKNPKNKEKIAMSMLGRARQTSIHRPKISLDHVVLTPELRKNIDNFIWFYRKKDSSNWNLKELGLSTGNALFYGPPGTGKTLLAEAIAGELRLEIAKVRYEEIIDCWVGNSEKNIKSVFDSNSNRGKVILFDECDALLEKRGNATDSVDRMNNRVINIILQELERYPGIVIFTTNRAVELDEALSRRIHLKMELPRPGAPEREKIWRKMTTGKVPLAEGIEWGRLAEFDLSGGEIKNVILNLAKNPEVNTPEVKITTEHLAAAARNELQGRISSEKKGRMGFITN